MKLRSEGAEKQLLFGTLGHMDLQSSTFDGGQPLAVRQPRVYRMIRRAQGEQSDLSQRGGSP